MLAMLSKINQTGEAIFPITLLARFTRVVKIKVIE
jgi:hypothetical protein